MTQPTTNTKASRSAGRIVLIVAGSLVALLGLLTLAGGGTLTAVHQTERDDDGFYTSSANSLSTPTHALVSEGLEVGTGESDRLFREGRLGTVRVQATATEEPIFLGIAPQAQLDAYLRGVAHDEVADFEVDPFSVTYARRPGTAQPSAPAGQGFWAEQASGTGTQTVTWPVQKGEWAVVAMNADGSPVVQTDVSVGAKVGWLLWLGIGLLIGGGILALGGGALIVFAVRRRRRAGAADAGTESAPATSAVRAGGGR